MTHSNHNTDDHNTIHVDNNLITSTINSALNMVDANKGAHNSHSLKDGMVMSFHGGFQETILFEFWETNSIAIFVVSCVALFILAGLYEGIKLLREKLIRYEIGRRKQFEHLGSNNSVRSNVNKSLLNQDEQNIDEVAIESGKNKNISELNSNANQNTFWFKTYSSRLFSRGHIFQTFLHMLQITVSYLLMLVFMTYNSWLCLSIVLGAGLGYFLFGLKRLSTIDVNEHCH